MLKYPVLKAKGDFKPSRYSMWIDLCQKISMLLYFFSENSEIVETVFSPYAIAKYFY